MYVFCQHIFFYVLFVTCQRSIKICLKKKFSLQLIKTTALKLKFYIIAQYYITCLRKFRAVDIKKTSDIICTIGTKPLL